MKILSSLRKKSGILPEFVNTSAFLRADVVTVSYTALSAKLKGSEQPLSEKLISEGVFDLSQYVEHYDRNAIGRKSASLVNTKNDLSSKEIFDSCSPAVICIETYDANEKPCALGSGFFITGNGVAVTNFHVLENATFAVAKLGSNWYTVMGVLYFDKELDFAVIKTNATNVPYLNIGDSSDIYSGEEIYTIGNPQGLTNTISDGIIANPNREDYNGMIQITAPISSGSSGGALLNSRGEVIGITTGTLTSGQNLNFAVPIGEVVNKNEISTIETKYNMFTMEEFATYNGYNVKIEPPKNIRVVRQQNGSAHIQWDEVEGAEYYHFYYQEAGEENFWFTTDDNGEKIKFEHRNDYTVSCDGLENGKRYNVIVTAVKNGVESKDSEILTFVFNALSTQEIAINNLKQFVLGNQNGTISGKPLYKEVYDDANGSEQYSIVYNAEYDDITLIMKKIYNGSWTYSYTTLTRKEQTYFCAFSFYQPSNQSNTPDFYATYTIDADDFGENSNIYFEKIEGDKSNQNVYKELAKFMNLSMLGFTDFIFDNYMKNTGSSISDFGFSSEISSNNTSTNQSPNVVVPENTQINGSNSSGYYTNTQITLSSFPLYLYADDGTGTFLGEISSNKYDTDSIANEYGNYGSKYQTKSIFNQYGNYGSKYSQYSVFNEYATKPPKILDKNGKVVGYLTANQYIKDAISYEEMMVLLKKFNK